MNTAVASRGYLKIEGAARAFNFDFKGKVVLDIGSSTGGFTEYALAHGATKVIAVEKGSHQMKAPLRFDSRVELHEKTDIFNVELAGSMGTKPRGAFASTGASEEATRDFVPMLPTTPDVIVADVSFISLTKILKYAKMNLARQSTDYLVMLKPQFEATEHELHSGIVKNDKLRREIIKRFEFWLKRNGFLIVKKHDNCLRGKHGNTERFYWLRATR